MQVTVKPYHFFMIISWLILFSSGCDENHSTASSNSSVNSSNEQTMSPMHPDHPTSSSTAGMNDADRGTHSHTDQHTPSDQNTNVADMRLDPSSDMHNDNPQSLGDQMMNPSADQNLDSSVELPDDTIALMVNEQELETARVLNVSIGQTTRFYSYRYKAFIEFQPHLPPNDPLLVSQMADINLEVHITLDANRKVSIAVYDVAGLVSPMVAESTLPMEGTHNLHINSFEQLENDSMYIPFTENPENPFGDFTVPDLLVALNISAIVTSIAVSTATSVFAGLARGACDAIIPLHGEICAFIERVINFFGGLVIPGIKLLRGAVSLGTFVFKNIVASGVAPLLCEGGTRYLTKAINEENTNEVNALRDSYRIALSEYHYLLYLFETNPPQDPQDLAAMQSALVHTGSVLVAIGPDLREGYVRIHNTDHPVEDQSTYIQLKPILSAFLSGMTVYQIEWTTIFTTSLTRAIFINNGPHTLVGVETTLLQVSQQTLRELKSVGRVIEIGEWLQDCAIGVYTGLEGVVNGIGNNEPQVVTMTQLYSEAIHAVRRGNQAIHTEYYGNPIIPLECTFDEYEGNATSMSAIASPTGFSVGSGPIWLRDLTLCSGVDQNTDEDWYAFPMDIISFDVQARLKSPNNSSFAADYTDGLDENVCVNVYYYGESNEIVGQPPSLVHGSCGTPSDLWTGSRGIRRVIGESWSYILLHVYAPDGLSDSVAYDLGFVQ